MYDFKRKVVNSLPLLAEDSTDAGVRDARTEQFDLLAAEFDDGDVGVRFGQVSALDEPGAEPLPVGDGGVQVSNHRGDVIEVSQNHAGHPIGPPGPAGALPTKQPFESAAAL